MLKKLWEKVRNEPAFKVVLLVLLVFALGFLVGQNQEPPPPKVEVRTVVDTESREKLAESLKVQQQLREQLDIAEKTKTDTKVRVVEKVKIVYQKDGTVVVDSNKTSDSDTKVDASKTTTDTKSEDTSVAGNKTSDTTTETHSESKTIVATSVPKDKYYAGVSGTIGITGLSRPGIELKYRLLDLGKISVWAGAEGIVGLPLNPTDVQLRLAAGISF